MQQNLCMVLKFELWADFYLQSVYRIYKHFCSWNSATWKVKIEDTNVKRAQQYEYLVRFLTNDGKCDSEIRRYIGIDKAGFQKLSRALSKSKISLEKKEKEY